MRDPVLTEAEKARVTEAVIEAERRTSGEIVTLVVRASDDYAGARWRIAVAFTLIGLGVMAALLPALAPTLLLLASIPLLGVGHLLAVWRPLLRLALEKREVIQEVRQKAHEAFVDLNVHATRDRTGVLIMVSMLEHRIEILADTGIHTSAPPGYWDQVVAELSVRIKRGELADGLAEAVGAVGALLAEKFPAQARDENELPDRVIAD